MSLPKHEPPIIPYEEARTTVVTWKIPGRKKKPNPVHFVDCAWNLVYRYHKGSFEEAANDVKVVTARTLERLASIDELPESVIQSLEKGEIGIDVASSIAGFKDLEIQARVAKIVAHMNAHDARQVVGFAKRYPDASLEQFKQRVLSSRDTTEKIYMAILPLAEEEYKKLKGESERLRMSWDELCMKIIKDWLNARRP